MLVHGQHSKSIHVKVDTGTGSNIVLLPVFWHLYPTQGRPDGTPSGLSHSLSKRRAYSSTRILQYGTLDSDIVWQP